MGHREMADVIAQKRARDLGGLSNPVCRTEPAKRGYYLQEPHICLEHFLPPADMQT